MTILADALEKLRWADHHLSELEADAWEWVADKAHLPPFAEYVHYPEQRKFAFRFTDLPVVGADWTLRAADAINNYRSALDYIAWQLVDAGSEPKPLDEPKARRVQFPIVYEWKPNETPDAAFLRMRGSQLPGVDPTFIQVVERHQPYKWGTTNLDNHPLARLARFSNQDKHRQLRLIGTDPTAVTFDIVRAINCEIAHVQPLPSDQCQPNAEFLWIYYTPTNTDEPDVLVKIGTGAVVTFADGPIFETTMREIAAEVRTIADEFTRLI